MAAVDIDATITIDHSDRKENAAPTWKKTFGHHGLFAFVDRPAIAGGEGLAGLCAGETPAPTLPLTTSACSPGRWRRSRQNYRPDPADPDGPKVLVRSDSAGATYGFAEALP